MKSLSLAVAILFLVHSVPAQRGYYRQPKSVPLHTDLTGTWVGTLSNDDGNWYCQVSLYRLGYDTYWGLDSFRLEKASKKSGKPAGYAFRQTFTGHFINSLIDPFDIKNVDDPTLPKVALGYIFVLDRDNPVIASGNPYKPNQWKMSMRRQTMDLAPSQAAWVANSKAAEEAKILADSIRQHPGYHDVTGTWEGLQGPDVYNRIYLTKLGDYTYSGISSLSFRNTPGDTTIPFYDPRLRNINVLFVAYYNSGALTFVHLDTCMHSSPVQIRLQQGIFQFNFDKDGDEINTVTTDYVDHPYHFRRTSTTVPPAFAKNEITLSSLQVKDLSFGPSPVDDAPCLHFFINNTTPVAFNALEVELFSERKDGFDVEHLIGSPIMSASSSVGKEGRREITVRLEQGLPEDVDTVYFSLRINSNDTYLAFARINVPTRAIADQRRDQAVNGAAKEKLIGVYKGSAVVATDGLARLFSNDYVEFFSDGSGISRSSRGGALHPPHFFHWTLEKDSLHLEEPGQRLSRFAFKFSDSNLVVQSGAGGSGTAVTLGKLSSNPLANYQDWLTSAGVGTWSRAASYSDNQMYPGDGLSYDIHQTGPAYGEVILYPKSEKMDSMDFVKWNSLSTFDQANPNGHYYSFEWMNAEVHRDVNFYFGGDLLIMNESGLRNIYLQRTGTSHWTDPQALHERYNTFAGKEVLGQYGTHTQACYRCFGRGQVVDHYDDVYDYTDKWGDRFYKKQEVYAGCPVCQGRGGYLVDDNTGQRIK
jgi:hypothetical protein